MIFFKPVARTIVLSTILAFLLMFLGIKYHWGDYLRITQSVSNELLIPDKTENTIIDQVNLISVSQNKFTAEIVKGDRSFHLIEVMNKEQVTVQCMRLLSKTIVDNLLLDLAVANCVVSNYQEIIQDVAQRNSNYSRFIKKCNLEFNQQAEYSTLEKQLLVGICVSDNLTQ